jgi:acyl-CoA dehydrogenase
VVREFVEREVVPLYAEWEQAGELPRKFFRQLGALGVMGMAVPEEYGGAGDSDYRYNVVLQKEAARAQVTLGTLRTQLEVILPYFLGYITEFPIARLYADARVTRIYGGTSEVMKLIISKSLGL